MVSRGLGDTIEKVTHATGIALAINRYHLSCVCPELQAKLNQAFPYARNQKED